MNRAYKIVLGLAVIAGLIAAHGVDARGGGGRGGGGRASSRSSVSRTTTRSTTPRTTTKTTTPRVSKTRSATRVTSPTAKKVNGKTYSRTGNVVDDSYTPHFSGYVPPRGATVYYRDSSWDWLPFYLILTNQQHREAVVVEPGQNGAPATEKVVKEEGIDTMYWVNWLITLLFCGGVIALIVWLVNKNTKKPKHV